LLDTGSDYNFMPSRFVPDSLLKPCDVELFAVNSTQLHVKGTTCWQFTVRKLVFSADVIVSADTDDVIFGVSLVERK